MGGRAVQWAEPTRTRVREPWGRYQFRAPTAVCIWARRGAGKGGRRAWPDFTTRVSRLIAFFTVVVSSSCTRTTAQWIRAMRARLTLALTSRTCVTYVAKKPETAAATDRRRSTTSKTYLAMQYATSNVRSSVSHILDQSFDVWPAFRGRNSPQQYSRPQSLQQSPSLFFMSLPLFAGRKWTTKHENLYLCTAWHVMRVRLDYPVCRVFVTIVRCCLLVHCWQYLMWYQ